MVDCSLRLKGENKRTRVFMLLDEFHNPLGRFDNSNDIRMLGEGEKKIKCVVICENYIHKVNYTNFKLFNFILFLK